MSETILLEIESAGEDKVSAFEMFDHSGRLARGDTFDVGDDVQVQYQGTIVRKAIGVPETLELAIHVADAVGYVAAADWLWTQISNRSVRIRIDGKPVNPEKEEIQSTIEDYAER